MTQIVFTQLTAAEKSSCILNLNQCISVHGKSPQNSLIRKMSKCERNSFRDTRGKLQQHKPNQTTTLSKKLIAATLLPTTTTITTAEYQKNLVRPRPLQTIHKLCSL
jgi:hypothetical protein